MITLWAKTCCRERRTDILGRKKERKKLKEGKRYKEDQLIKKVGEMWGKTKQGEAGRKN